MTNNAALHLQSCQHKCMSNQIQQKSYQVPKSQGPSGHPRSQGSQIGNFPAKDARQGILVRYSHIWNWYLAVGRHLDRLNEDVRNQCEHNHLMTGAQASDEQP